MKRRKGGKGGRGKSGVRGGGVLRRFRKKQLNQKDLQVRGPDLIWLEYKNTTPSFEDPFC